MTSFPSGCECRATPRDYVGTSLGTLRRMVALDISLTFLTPLYVTSGIKKRADDVVVGPFPGRKFSRSIGLVRKAISGAAATFERLAQAIRDTARRLPELEK